MSLTRKLVRTHNNRSTSEHNSTRFGKLQCMATSFVFDYFWSCDHPPNDLLDGPWQAKSSVSCFSSLFYQNRWNFLFWIYSVDPENSTWHAIHHSYFCSHFLAIFRTMKSSGAKNEIVIESARHPDEMCNEISRATFERSQWSTQGYIWKTTMKAAEYWMKSHNEMHWVPNEK